MFMHGSVKAWTVTLSTFACLFAIRRAHADVPSVAAWVKSLYSLMPG